MNRLQAMTFLAASPIQFSDPLPAATDIVIIGGGIIGVMAAWFLAKRGIKAVICEKGRIAGEQSSRNWGWIRQQGRDPAELPIMIEASQIWQGLEKESGEDLGFRRTGVLYLANSAKDMALYEDWLKIAKSHQLDTNASLRRAKWQAMLAGQPSQLAGRALDRQRWPRRAVDCRSCPCARGEAPGRDNYRGLRRAGA